MIGSWVREYAVQMEFATPDLGIESLLAVDAADAITFDGDSAIGITGDGTTASSGRFKLLLTNKPDLIASTAIQEIETATGQADNAEEDIIPTISQPNTFAPEINAHTYNISLFLATLLQSGYTEADAGAVRTGTCIAYKTPNIMRYLSFVEVLQKLAANATPATPDKSDNSIMRVSMPSSVKFSASEGGILKVSADLKGAGWETGFSLPAAYNTSGVSVKVSPLKWQDAKVILQDAYVTAADAESGIADIDATNKQVSMNGLDLTIENNLTHKYYNSSSIVSFVLGKLKSSGTMVIPWTVANQYGDESQYYWQQIKDFQAGITKRLIVYWNSSTGTGFTFSGANAVTDDAPGGFLIDMFIKYSSGALDSAEVLGSNMGFTCVVPTGGTSSIRILCTYAATGTNATRRV
jgi:hypothetical protein